MSKDDPLYRIEWRPTAREDLRAIVRYIGQHNPSRALSFGKELRAKTLPLALHPELGRPGGADLPQGVRELIAHRNYIILYRVIVEERLVEIMRVKHAAQQLP